MMESIASRSVGFWLMGVSVNSAIRAALCSWLSPYRLFFLLFLRSDIPALILPYFNCCDIFSNCNEVISFKTSD